MTAALNASPKYMRCGAPAMVSWVKWLSKLVAEHPDELSLGDAALSADSPAYYIQMCGYAARNEADIQAAAIGEAADISIGHLIAKYLLRKWETTSELVRETGYRAPGFSDALGCAEGYWNTLTRYIGQQDLCNLPTPSAEEHSAMAHMLQTQRYQKARSWYPALSDNAFVLEMVQSGIRPGTETLREHDKTSRQAM